MTLQSIVDKWRTKQRNHEPIDFTKFATELTPYDDDPSAHKAIGHIAFLCNKLGVMTAQYVIYGQLYKGEESYESLRIKLGVIYGLLHYHKQILLE